MTVCCVIVYRLQHDMILLCIKGEVVFITTAYVRKSLKLVWHVKSTRHLYYALNANIVKLQVSFFNTLPFTYLKWDQYCKAALKKRGHAWLGSGS